MGGALLQEAGDALLVVLGLEQDAQDMGMFYASQKPFDMKNASLYWRLGGPDAVNAAVEETRR